MICPPLLGWESSRDSPPPGKTFLCISALNDWPLILWPILVFVTLPLVKTYHIYPSLDKGTKNMLFAFSSACWTCLLKCCDIGTQARWSPELFVVSLHWLNDLSFGSSYALLDLIRPIQSIELQNLTFWCFEIQLSCWNIRDIIQIFQTYQNTNYMNKAWGWGSALNRVATRDSQLATLVDRSGLQVLDETCCKFGNNSDGNPGNSQRSLEFFGQKDCGSQFGDKKWWPLRTCTSWSNGAIHKHSKITKCNIALVT